MFTEVTKYFDEFMTDYKDKMSKRIIYLSINIEAEEKVLEIFKKSGKMSPEQTCHLNRMLLDYKEKHNSVLVLTSHAWPSSCNPIILDSLTLPKTLDNLIREFEDEYKEFHCGRRLQWCPQLITLQTYNGTSMSLLQYQIISSLPLSVDTIQQVSNRLGRSFNETTTAIKVLQECGVVSMKNGLLEFVCLPANLNLIPVLEEASNYEEVTSLAHKHNTSSEIDASLKARQSFIIQSLIVTILKRKRQISPAELKKLLFLSVDKLQHDHSFLPQAIDIDEAIKSLTGKGYLEFNEQDYLYIYVP